MTLNLFRPFKPVKSTILESTINDVAAAKSAHQTCHRLPAICGFPALRLTVAFGLLVASGPGCQAQAEAPGAQAAVKVTVPTLKLGLCYDRTRGRTASQGHRASVK